MLESSRILLRFEHSNASIETVTVMYRALECLAANGPGHAQYTNVKQDEAATRADAPALDGEPATSSNR